MLRHAETASQHSSIGIGLSLSNIDCVVGADIGNAVLSGLPAHLIRRLQSVMNAAARSPLAIRASERTDFKLATLTYRCLYGAAPSYLSCDLRRLADIPSGRWLRSSASNALDVPPTRLSSVGD
jgi:hypothetical protein